METSGRWLQAVALTAGLMLAAPSAAQLGLKVESTGVTVSGASPGGSVLVLGVGRERFRPTATRRYFVHEVLEDSQGGQVKLTLEAPPPTLSVWIAIDEKSGRLALADSSGLPLQATDRKPPRGSDPIDLEVSPIEEPVLVLVRPSEGSWIWLGEGAILPANEDGTPQQLEIPTSSFQNLGKAPASFAALKDQDLIVTVDQRTLEVGFAVVP